MISYPTRHLSGDSPLEKSTGGLENFLHEEPGLIGTGELRGKASYLRPETGLMVTVLIRVVQTKMRGPTEKAEVTR